MWENKLVFVHLMVFRVSLMFASEVAPYTDPL